MNPTDVSQSADHMLSGLLSLISGFSLQDWWRLGILYLCLVWGAIVIWVIRDATRRSDSLLFHILATLLVLVLTPVFGLPLYLILRPSEVLDHVESDELENDGILPVAPRYLLSPSQDLVPVVVYVPRSEVAQYLWAKSTPPDTKGLEEVKTSVES